MPFPVGVSQSIPRSATRMDNSPKDSEPWLAARASGQAFREMWENGKIEKVALSDCGKCPGRRSDSIAKSAWLKASLKAYGMEYCRPVCTVCTRLKLTSYKCCRDEDGP